MKRSIVFILLICVMMFSFASCQKTNKVLSADLENTYGNRMNDFIVCDDGAYYNTHSEGIWNLDGDGNHSVVVDTENIEAFDIYEGKAYYLTYDSEGYDIMCSDMNGNDQVIYSDLYLVPHFELFLIDKGVLYFNDDDDSIKCIDLKKDDVSCDVYRSELKVAPNLFYLSVYGYDATFFDGFSNSCRFTCYGGNAYYFDWETKSPLYTTSLDSNGDKATYTELIGDDIYTYNIYDGTIYYCTDKEPNILRSVSLDGTDEKIIAEFDHDFGTIGVTDEYVYLGYRLPQSETQFEIVTR